MTLDELTAIEEIRRLKARYFRFLDRKQWDEWTDLFVEDLHVEIDEPGATMALDSRADFVAATSKALEGIITVHHGHMSEITLDGLDKASAIWSMEDHLSPAPGGGDHYWGMGWYEERYEADDTNTWRIAETKLVRQRVVLDGKQIFPAT
jgi:hypothetical protein